MLEKILAEYDEYRNNAERERKMRIAEVYEKFPKLKDIDNEIFKSGSENIQNIIQNPENSEKINADFKKHIKKLKEEKEQLVKEYKINPLYDKTMYRCDKCRDTGYTDDGKKCICLKQKLINVAYSKSNLGEILEKQNFSKFSFDYYSKIPVENNDSPYETMQRIYKCAVNFCKNFDNETKGLIFYGKTGLGKTFLSSCIAKELMDNGKTVIYARAAKMFGIYEDYKFGRNSDKSIIDEIYNCDLLIIDDLGTEPKSNINVSFLFEVINERMSDNKKIIINTNLDMPELSKMYSQRFISRVFEYFIINKFIGEDIRLQMVTS